MRSHVRSHMEEPHEEPRGSSTWRSRMRSHMRSHMEEPHGGATWRSRMRSHMRSHVAPPRGGAARGQRSRLVMPEASGPRGGQALRSRGQHTTAGSVLVPASTSGFRGMKKVVSSVTLGLERRRTTTWIWFTFRSWRTTGPHVEPRAEASRVHHTTR